MTKFATLFFYLLATTPLVAFSFVPHCLLSHRPSQQSLLLVLNAETQTIKQVESEANDRMSKSVESVRTNLGSIRTGRASASILDRVRVEYYGVETPLNQMAGISVPSAQQLSIDPYDKTQLAAIERAIADSDLGLTASNDGSVIRINIPPLTEDRRKEMLKQCKAIGEEGKVAVRNIRRDGVDTIKKIEKGGTIGEDEMKDGLDVMQKMTDKRIKEIESVVAAKEKEVMKV
jgi:ribosome recycling factor